jgi:hypothetical protein
MKVWAQLQTLWSARSVPVVIAILCLLAVQFYAVRELLAAEVLFAVAFIFLSLIVGAFYVVGHTAERGADVLDNGLHMGARQAQQGYHDLEHVTRKWIEGARIFHAHR